VRGDGGYVIAPPSRHRSLQSYEWRNFDADLPDLPHWALERLTARPSAHTEAQRSSIPTHGSGAWARSALAGEADSVRTAPEGTRNQALNRAAFCLGQIVGAGALEPGAVEAALLQSALNAGLGEREALQTLKSGLTAGIAHPRGARGCTSEPVERRSSPDRAELGLG
jgi:hypothetical protein